MNQELLKNLRRAVNGTGMVIHEGLGRAPLAIEVLDVTRDVLSHYCTLEISANADSAEDRSTHVEQLLKEFTAAEAAMVVNNNAAALLLILNTLAGGRNAVIAREELVETGSGFRILDLIKTSGAKAVEVGAANRCTLEDYRQGLKQRSGLVLCVHHSSFHISGAADRIPLEELAGLAHERNVPVVCDLGTGAFFDFRRWGLRHESMVWDTLQAGADVVCFSGDKLLGGPQCGVILGKKELIDRLKKNPLLRMLRCGKLTLSNLEATLRLLLDKEKAVKSHPILRMLTQSPDRIKRRCRSLKRKLNGIIDDRGYLQIQEATSPVGSDALAAERLPTWVLAIHIAGIPPQELDSLMRSSTPPIFGKFDEQKYFLDCRTIRKNEYADIARAFRRILDESSNELSDELQKATEEMVDDLIHEFQTDDSKEKLRIDGE